MGVLKDGYRVTKKEFDFEIPEFLDKNIDLLIAGNNSGDLMTDCYLDDLYNNINNCLHTCLTDEQANEIREYYIFGGMYLNAEKMIPETERE